MPRTRRIPYKRMTYANASARSARIDGAVVYGQYAANIPPALKGGGEIWLQSEAARKNLVDVSPVDPTAWTAIGSATAEKDVATSPRGTLTAGRITFTAAAGDGMGLAISTIADSAKCIASCWVKAESGTKEFRFQILKKDNTTDTSAAKTATTTWQRLTHYLADILTGATVPAIRILNDAGGTAGTLLVWCAQAEAAAYPSSEIEAAVTTRAKDEISISASYVPAAARSRVGYGLYFNHASTDLAAADERTIWEKDDDLVHVKGYILNGAIGVKGVTDTLQGSVQDANRICADTSNIYYATNIATTAAVIKVPKTGGSPVTLASGYDSIASICTDGTNVYFSTYIATGRIYRVPCAGGSVTTMNDGNIKTRDICTDNTYVYFADILTGNVNKLACTADAATPTLIVHDTGATDHGSISGIAVDATSVYWANKDDDEISKYPLAGGSITQIYAAGASDYNNAYGIYVDATYLFWCDYSDGEINRVKLDGTGATAIASSQTNPLWITGDTTYVYWGTGDGYVCKVAKAGGNVTTLASGYTASRGIVVDASNIYWTDYVTGAATGGVYKVYACPFASAAHTWAARTKADIIFDAANKQIITSNFATGNGTTTGDAAYTTTGGIVYLGQDSAGANQLDGLITEPRLWV